MKNNNNQLATEGLYHITVSQNIEDQEWDAFVEFVAGGHFEQSSLWAQTKKETGWGALRILARQEDKILAGVQVLIRKLPLYGYAGYIPKGPLVPGNDLNVLGRLIKELKKKMEELKVFYIILQPPDDNEVVNEYLKKEGFLKERILQVISATTFIDLSQDEKTLLSRMTKKFRHHIRFAERNGIMVQEGGQEHISLFFKLMLETCKRQGVFPNPSTESFIQRLWSLFSPRGNIVLFLAHQKGEIISALIGIPFGKVFNAWKIGWSGEYENLGANHLLLWRTIQWARERGYRSYDFMGVTRSAAESILNGRHFYEVAKGPDLFKFSFGGEIQLLPEASYYIKNSLLGIMYKDIYPAVRKLEMIRSRVERF